MNFESHKDDVRSATENVKTLEQLSEGIKSPEELLEYMEKNLEYGYVGQESGRIYSFDDRDFDENFEAEYFLQTPEQLMKSGHGVCWDQTELERYWFSRRKYEAEVYFLIFNKQEPNDLPTHTFLVYKNNGKFYWFENSFGSQKGIHEYTDLDTLLEDVKERQFEYAKKECGATAGDRKSIKVFPYETPIFGCAPREFIARILDANPKESLDNK